MVEIETVFFLGYYVNFEMIKPYNLHVLFYIYVGFSI